LTVTEVDGDSNTKTRTNHITVTPVPKPTITSVNPSSGRQNQNLSVVITGTYFTGAASVSFGSGITVNSFTVDSDTQIPASITISGSATVGARDVSVTTAGGTATLTASFTVKEKASEIGGCSCSHAKANTSTSELLIGWGTVGLCLSTCYGLAKRVVKKRRK
jgi:hypothetical protein